MSTDDRVIECPCGVILTGSSETEVVERARAHAGEVHDMELSEADARAMARPA